MTTRRSFLAFLAASGSGSTVTLAGCAAKNAQPPSADGALRAGAAASARALAALYEAALNGAELNGAATAVDRAEAALYRSHHLAHAQRLTGTSNDASPTTTVAAAANASPTTATIPTRKDLAAAERTAPGTSAAAMSRASGDLAVLLASIAACRALHAQSLDPSQSPIDAPPLATTKTSSSNALQAMLSAQHAAIFAYGALGPHLTGSQRSAAHAAFDVHRGQRDVLMAAIGARGGSPRAAEASYDLPFRVTDAASGCHLAALVESRLTAVCAQAVSTSSDSDRTYAAWALTQAALRAQTWGAPVTAFPGLDANV